MIPSAYHSHAGSITDISRGRSAPRLALSAVFIAATSAAACGGDGASPGGDEVGVGGGAAHGGTSSAGHSGTGTGTTGGATSGGTSAAGAGGTVAAGTGGAAGNGNASSGGHAGSGLAGGTGAGAGGGAGVASGGISGGGDAGTGTGGGGRVGGAGSGGQGPGGGAGQGPQGGGAGAGGGSGGGAVSICDFASGLNVAWVNFARDVPNPDLNAFKTIFKNTYDAGGRVIRWWFHTNGSVTPGYDSQGRAQPLQQSHIDGVKAILAAAHDAGVVIDLSLWSFDMLQDNAGTAYTNNKLLLENDTNRQAYVDNYLTPLVTAIKGTPGLYAWEIFNEPEGMGPKGWATYRTTEAAIQKTVNWLAAAIHSADPSALVTNGAQTFDYCSNVSGKNNLYSDAALIAAGGKQNGTLDFYQVHYYTSNGTSNSAFTHPASYWNLDKKLVIGEFAAADTDGVVQNDLYTNLYTNGYDGAWAWSYDADWPWPAMQAPMKALFTAHADVGSCP
jgi:hypothetical protein